MNCKNCGAELNEGAIFCGNCGMRVEPEIKAEPEQPVYEEPVKEEPAQECFQESYTSYQEQGSYVPPVMPEYNSNPAQPAYVPAEKPNTVLWIVLAAVEIFTCCTVTGIVSLIYAILGHVAADKGDFAEAEKKTKTAKIWFWVGLILGIVAIVAYFILVAVGVAAGLAEEFYYYY